MMQVHKDDNRQGLDLNLGCSKFMPLLPKVPGDSDNTRLTLRLGLTKWTKRGHGTYRL